MKEILLYSSIYSYTVSDFITAMEEAKGSDVRIRVNSPGGEVYYGYGAIAKFNEHPNKKIIQVDGRADSFAAIMCCCAENVECLDVSTFLFHRAAFPEWIESSAERFTDDLKASLSQINGQLRAFMEGKMKAEDFQKATGVSYDELFSLDSRIDVVLDAKQAKKLGLVQKITTITPAKKAEIESQVLAIAARSIPAVPEQSTPTNTPSQSPKKIMTAAEFKAAHPAAYAEIINEGIAAERDRVGAYMAFVGVDPEAVSKGIEEGKPLTQKQMADFSIKMMSATALAAVAGDNTPNVVTTEEETKPSVAANKTAEYEAALFKDLGLKVA